MWVLWAAPAFAEQIRVESLDWQRADADSVVVGVVEAVEPRPLGGTAWVAEHVTVRVEEVLGGDDPGAAVSFSMQVRPELALVDRPNAPVLLFLRRVDGGYAPRGPYVDLEAPRAASAVTADCRLLETGDDVVAYVRDLPDVPRGATPRFDACDPGTSAHAALWSGSDVDVILPAPAPVGVDRPALYLSAYTEPMRWFGLGALSIEWVGCVVGVPVEGDGPPWVGCSSPGGAASGAPVPRGLGKAARQAWRAAEGELDHRATRRTTTFLGTESRAFLCGHALRGGLWARATLTVALDDDGPTEAVGAWGSSTEGGMIGCSGQPLVWASEQALLPTVEHVPSLLADREPLVAPDAADGWAVIPTRFSFEGSRLVLSQLGSRVAIPARARDLRTRVRFLIVDEGGGARLIQDRSASGVPLEGALYEAPPLDAGARVTAIVEVWTSGPDGDEVLASWAVPGGVPP
jgi:hypothetical protein